MKKQIPKTYAEAYAQGYRISEETSVGDLQRKGKFEMQRILGCKPCGTDEEGRIVLVRTSECVELPFTATVVPGRPRKYGIVRDKFAPGAFSTDAVGLSASQKKQAISIDELRRILKR